MRRTCESGQATVEAAFLLPVLFVGLLLLMQPGILLYDRLVMQAAASEGCRLLATKTAAAGDMAESCEAFVRHRLGAIPPVSCFVVRVTIANEARPLPLLDAGGALLGIVNGNGNLEVRVTAEQPTQPSWARSSDAGGDPAGWIGAWAS